MFFFSFLIFFNFSMPNPNILFKGNRPIPFLYLFSAVSCICNTESTQHRITFCPRDLQYSGWFFSHLYTGTYTWKLYSPVDFDKCFKYHTEKFLQLKMFWLEPFKVLLSPKTLTETELFHNPCSFAFSRMS